MPRRSKRPGTSRKPPPLPRGFETRADCAWTDGGQWEDIVLDLRAYSSVAIDGSVFRRVRFTGLVGNLVIGAGTPRSRFEDCRFVEARIRRLRLCNVDLERCEFVDCVIDELWTDGADLVGCRFSGSLDGAVVRRALPGEFPGAPQPPHAPRFVDNDFSDCEFKHVEFRGGIDLRRQRFSAEQSARIVFDVGARLDAVLARHPEATLTPSQRRRVEMLRRSCTRWRQRDDYLSETLTAGDDASVGELMGWLAAAPIDADAPGYVWTPDDSEFPPVAEPAAEDISDRAALLAAVADPLVNAQRMLGTATLERYCADDDCLAAVALQLGIAAEAAIELRETDRATYRQLPGIDKLVKLASYFGPGDAAATHRRAYTFVTQHSAALVAAVRGVRE